MSFTVTSLPSIPHASPSHLSKKLPDLRPLFFVPPLEDRPQNPIVDALVQLSSLPDPAGRYEDVMSLPSNELELVEEPEEELWTEERVFGERNERKVLPHCAFATERGLSN
jgi:hypothetical protein